ncbi:hypothetical protein Tco_1352120 [Tanacetum coccineum]
MEKRKTPLSEENAGTSSAEYIDLDKDIGKIHNELERKNAMRTFLSFNPAESMVALPVCCVSLVKGPLTVIRQSWKKGRLPLSAENAGTSAVEDIDLDKNNGKYMMTGKEECEEENVKKNTKRTGQSWKKGRLPLSAENAGTSAAEDIDLDEDNGKYMMTGKEECEEENVKKNTKRTGGRNFVGDCRDATTKERNQQRFVDKKRDTEKGKGLVIVVDDLLNEVEPGNVPNTEETTTEQHDMIDDDDIPMAPILRNKNNQIKITGRRMMNDESEEDEDIEDDEWV